MKLVVITNSALKTEKERADIAMTQIVIVPILILQVLYLLYFDITTK